MQSNVTTGKTRGLSKKVLLTAIIVIIIAMTVLIAAVCLVPVAGENICDNVYVLETNIGGLTKEEARTLLNDTYFDIFEGKSVKLVCEDSKKDVKLSSINASVNFDDLINRAYAIGRESDFFENIQNKFSPKEKINLDLAVNFNEEQLISVINETVLGKEEESIDYSYEIAKNKIIINPAKGGLLINREIAVEKVKEAIQKFDLDSDIVLNLERLPAPEFDADSFYEKIAAEPVNPTYEKKNGEVIVTPGKPGVKLDKEDLKNVVSGEDEKRFEVPATIINPTLSESEMKSKMFQKLLYKYTSNFNSGDVPRSSNIRNAAGRINGTILLPGEVFSYNGVVGQRTAANGFKVAHVYVGDKVEDGLGGGICQVSSTLYSAVLYANLEIVERSNHSLPVGYVPGGQDATVSYGTIDFKFKNSTNYPIKIVMIGGGSYVTAELYGTDDYGYKVELSHSTSGSTPFSIRQEADPSIPQGTKKIKQTGKNGFSVTSYRTVKNNGTVIKTQFLSTSVYRPFEQIELVNPADKGKSPEEIQNQMPTQSEPPDALPLQSFAPSASPSATPPIQGGDENTSVPPPVQSVAPATPSSAASTPSNVPTPTPSSIPSRHPGETGNTVTGSALDEE